ncbi:hypothetical protein Slin15195_G056120 [Septoria linicola]|uniref:Uncharacterized protein n=1 Tax=Septoria linicola TaxID=215465 RepID=A0A9Q9EKD8_9PEZI|nr:hypothetical protein Slin14017_G072000 [Septoria linicola]USW52293.1 hypothetical protein Slin15195_G056120 [Septoria linicola]
MSDLPSVSTSNQALIRDALRFAPATVSRGLEDAGQSTQGVSRTSRREPPDSASKPKPKLGALQIPHTIIGTNEPTPRTQVAASLGNLTFGSFPSAADRPTPAPSRETSNVMAVQRARSQAKAQKGATGEDEIMEDDEDDNKDK